MHSRINKRGNKTPIKSARNHPGVLLHSDMKRLHLLDWIIKPVRTSGFIHNKQPFPRMTLPDRIYGSQRITRIQAGNL